MNIMHVTWLVSLQYFQSISLDCTTHELLPRYVHSPKPKQQIKRGSHIQLWPYEVFH